MGTVKRVYLYAASSISLLVLAVGLYNLASVILVEVADAIGAGIVDRGEDVGREQVSLAIALVAVGLPIFAIHWWLVGRGWHGDDDAARGDRRSPIRAFHMSLVSTVALAVSMFAAVQVLDEILGSLLGVERFADTQRLSDSMAMLVVAAPVWWYHANARNHDLRRDRLTGAAAWLSRLHRYGWAFIGLIVLVVGASQVLETLASVLIGRYDIAGDDRLWLGELVWSVSAIVTGSGVFWLHANDARLAIRDAAFIGEDDRSTRLRLTYFGAVILVALVNTAIAVASSLAELGRWAAGVGDAVDLPSFAELVIGPWLVALPFAVAGWVHWTALRREASGRSHDASEAAMRLAVHLVAGVGLASLAVGAGQLLGRFLELVIGSPFVDEFFTAELIWYPALIVVGAILWTPAWTLVISRRTSTATVERQATIGRAYLFLVVGAALAAGVPSAVFSLYRLIDTLLGGRGVALGSDLAIPLGVVVVAAIIAAYHARLLVADLRFAGEAAAPLEAAPVPGAVPSGEARVGASLALTLRGPVGTDLESLANTLREHLPAGVTLESS